MAHALYEQILPHTYVWFFPLGNLLAVGTMEPYINIWDLDVIDTVEPVLMLGEKKKKKHKKVRPSGFPFCEQVRLFWFQNFSSKH